MFHPSPLRYPGGKRKLIPFIKLLFKINNLEGGEYIEPYAGGASIALSLLFNEYVSKIHINDLSLPIYAFWNSILNNTEKFCQLIENTEVTMDEWHRQKKFRIVPISILYLTWVFQPSSSIAQIDLEYWTEV